MRRALVALAFLCIVQSAVARDVCSADHYHAMKRVTCEPSEDQAPYLLHYVGWLLFVQLSAHAKYFNDSCSRVMYHYTVEIDLPAPSFPKECTHERLRDEYSREYLISPEWAEFYNSLNQPVNRKHRSLLDYMASTVKMIDDWFGSPLTTVLGWAEDGFWAFDAHFGHPIQTGGRFVVMLLASAGEWWHFHVELPFVALRAHIELAHGKTVADIFGIAFLVAIFVPYCFAIDRFCPKPSRTGEPRKP